MIATAWIPSHLLCACGIYAGLHVLDRGLLNGCTRESARSVWPSKPANARRRGNHVGQNWARRVLVCRVLGPLLRVLLWPGLSGGPQEHAVPKDQVHDIVHAGRTVSVGPLSLVAIALAARNVSDFAATATRAAAGAAVALFAYLAQ